MTGSDDKALGRILAVALFLGLITGLVGIAAGAGYKLYMTEAEQAAALLKVSERARAVIARQQALADRLADIDERRLFETVYLEAPNSAVAVATLQDRISTLAVATGAQTRRISVVDGAGTSGRVSIQVQVTGDLHEISSFLVAVETHRPILSVERISINRMGRRRQLDARRSSADLQFAGALTLSVAIRGGGANGG